MPLISSTLDNRKALLLTEQRSPQTRAITWPKSKINGMADPIKKKEKTRIAFILTRKLTTINQAINPYSVHRTAVSWTGLGWGKFNPPVSAPKAAAAGARSRKDMGLSRCCGGWLMGGLRPRRIQRAKTPAGSNPEEKYFFCPCQKPF
jgi:hypothetical protein